MAVGNGSAPWSAVSRQMFGITFGLKELKVTLEDSIAAFRGTTHAHSPMISDSGDDSFKQAGAD
jgi:hypothetical protein